MFSWICPKCGAEVPPSYSECPRCSPETATAPLKTTASTVLEAPAAPPPPAPRPVAEPAAAVERVVPIPPPPASPPPRIAATAPAPIGRQFPAWLALVLTAAGMALVLALIYFVVRPSRPSERTQTAAPGPLESAPAAAKVENSQYAKNLELAGFRISEDKNQRV